MDEDTNALTPSKSTTGITSFVSGSLSCTIVFWELELAKREYNVGTDSSRPRKVSHMNGETHVVSGVILVRIMIALRADNPSSICKHPIPVLFARAIAASSLAAMPAPSHAPHWILCADKPEKVIADDQASIAALLAAYGDWPAAPVKAAIEENKRIDSSEAGRS